MSSERHPWTFAIVRAHGVGEKIMSFSQDEAMNLACLAARVSEKLVHDINIPEPEMNMYPNLEDHPTAYISA